MEKKDKTSQSQNQPQSFLKKKSWINVQNFIKSFQHNNTSSYQANQKQNKRGMH